MVQVHWTPELLRLLLTLPHLETLIVAPQANDPVDWSLLATAPALTSLTISSFSQRMIGLAACPHLRSLHLIRPELDDGGVFASFCSSLYMSQQLESLTLEIFSVLHPADATTVTDDASEFAALT